MNHLQDAVSYATAQRYFDVGATPPPFGHECLWCAKCCDKLRAMRDTVIESAQAGDAEPATDFTVQTALAGVYGVIDYDGGHGDGEPASLGLRIGSVRDRGMIVLDFNSPIAWISFTPEECERLEASLADHRMRLRGIMPG